VTGISFFLMVLNRLFYILEISPEKTFTIKPYPKPTQVVLCNTRK